MKLSKYIDHTILKPDATTEAVAKICEEARTYDFASVCVNLVHTEFVTESLKGTDVMTCTVVGFPLGAVLPEVKAYETQMAVAKGAHEIDMVINVGALKDGNTELVLRDIKAVVEAAGNAKVKVILETCLLTKEEIVTACRLSVEAGVAFVKTSTGFSTGGATVSDVKLMKETVGDRALVKASGGIRDYETAMAMIEAGASRIGASAGIAIVSKEVAEGDGY